MQTIQKDTTLDDEIQRLTGTLALMDPEEEGYEIVAENLTRLVKIKTEKNSNLISKDVMVGGAINILGILLVLNYEKLGVISSKAFSLIGKMRV